MSETKPLRMWLVDRSRFESGLHHCPRERYLRYHAGPHGYGWDKQAQSLPTVTGTLVHDPITTVLEYCRVHDTLPTAEWIYTEAITPAVAKYRHVVETRGLAAILDEADLQLKVIEQTTLLESLVWVYVRYVLPDYLREYRVVMVEREEVVVVGCTCGLGEAAGEPEDHDGRGCYGVAWMTRGDCIGQHRVTGTYRYDEFKTTGDAGMNWQAAWFHRVQMVAGVLGAERRLGVTIDEVYIPALVKGRRQAEWNPEEGKASGPKYQNTSLVYGGRRAANLPLYDEQWTAEWANQYYVGDDGKRHKRGKEYPRTGIWELPGHLWAQEGGLSPSDFWTRWLQPTGKLASAFTYVGPIYRKAWALDAFKDQLIGEEGRWQDAVWAVHEAVEAAGWNWADPTVQRVLDRVAPQARGEACESYFGDKCAYLGICDRYEGWENPLSMNYIPRRPHHSTELEQAVSRGCLLPDVGAADEVEDA